MRKKPTRAIGPRKQHVLPDGSIARSMVEIVMWHLWNDGKISRSFFVEKYQRTIMSFSGSGSEARKRLAKLHGLRNGEGPENTDFLEEYPDGDVVYSIKNFDEIRRKKGVEPEREVKPDGEKLKALQRGYFYAAKLIQRQEEATNAIKEEFSRLGKLIFALDGKEPPSLGL